MYFSNQFPVRKPEHPKTGRLMQTLPDGRRRVLVDDLPFAQLQIEKRKYEQYGYKNLKITY